MFYSKKNRTRKQAVGDVVAHKPNDKNNHEQQPDETPIETLVQRAQSGDTLNPAEVMQLQRTFGNQAVMRMMQGTVPQGAVQRLMTEKAFQKSTWRVGKRNKVVPIDNAVAAYEGMQKDVNSLYTMRAGLDTIVKACQTYLGLGKSAKRKTGVRALLKDAKKEYDLVQAIILSDGETDLKKRLRMLMNIQDAYLKLSAQGKNVDYLHDILNGDPDGKLTAAVNTAMANNPQALDQLVMEDLQALENLRDAPTTSTLLRNILTEVLANKDKVNFQHGKQPGATPTGPGAHTYDLDHGIRPSHGLGTTERLGSLAHELTHVSLGETFDNTMLMLAFRSVPITATTAEGVLGELRTAGVVAEIKSLIEERAQVLDDLDSLLANDNTFDPRQRALLQDKIKYPRSDTVGIPVLAKQLRNFQAAGKITTPLADAFIRFIFEVLSNPKDSGTVLEYDTVMNQMVLYLHQWGVDPGNAFHRRLQEAAQDAYDYRASHRT